MTNPTASASRDDVASTAVPARRPVVGAAILDEWGVPQRLLAARRSAPESLRGLWEFPGGKVEAGEAPGEALLREVREELGVELDLGAEVAAPDPEGWLLANGARMRVFLAVITSGMPRPLEDHDLLAWTDLTADDLHALEWIPADRPIVDALMTRVRPDPA